MKVELVNIDTIIPYARNPRNNTDAVDDVVSSIKEFGFKQPIVVDKENVIIVGHTRYTAAKRLDMKKVPVLKAIDLDENKVKAYRIADNRVNQNATWDYELLKLEFADIDLNTNFTGFELEEVNNIVDGWQTDIDLPTSDGESLDGLKPVLKLEFNNNDDKDQAINFIEEALEKTSINYEIK